MNPQTGVSTWDWNTIGVWASVLAVLVTAAVAYAIYRKTSESEKIQSLMSAMQLFTALAERPTTFHVMSLLREIGDTEAIATITSKSKTTFPAKCRPHLEFIISQNGGDFPKVSHRAENITLEESLVRIIFNEISYHCNTLEIICMPFRLNSTQQAVFVEEFFFVLHNNSCKQMYASFVDRPYYYPSIKVFYSSNETKEYAKHLIKSQ